MTCQTMVLFGLGIPYAIAILICIALAFFFGGRD